MSQREHNLADDLRPPCRGASEGQGGDTAQEGDSDDEPFWTDEELAQMREDSERQYSELKSTLKSTSVNFGGFLAVYLLLTNTVDVRANMFKP